MSWEWIFYFLSSLGLFLLGMNQLEDSLKNFVGSSFKRFLQKHTHNVFKSITSGIVFTAILQSSSVVGLIVLAFVGSGILKLHHALGIIIGSNLGTTFTGWIVSLFGFKLKIEASAQALISIGTLGGYLLSRNFKMKMFFQFFLGLGLMFWGLNSMKDSVSSLGDMVYSWNLSGHILIYYFVFGFILTAIIQSSSASMVIALSLLSAQLLKIEQAATFVIGADLGTTLTVILGALQGNPTKKQVAAGHFLFNFITDMIALLLVFPLLYFIQNILSITDPLLMLVAFHSSFNFLGILIFLPFLKVFSRFLERIFLPESTKEPHFLSAELLSLPDAAIEALENEVKELLLRGIKVNKSIFSHDLLEKYDQIKEREGAILDFVLQLQRSHLQPQQTERLQLLLLSVRNAIISIKDKKDIKHNLEEFRQEDNEKIKSIYAFITQQDEKFYQNIIQLKTVDNPQLLFAELVKLNTQARQDYDEAIKQIYQSSLDLNDREVSSFLNVNKEFYDSKRNLLKAIVQYELDLKSSNDFESLPH